MPHTAGFQCRTGFRAARRGRGSARVVSTGMATTLKTGTLLPALESGQVEAAREVTQYQEMLTEFREAITKTTRLRQARA